jgi:hypothetical protein
MTGSEREILAPKPDPSTPDVDDHRAAPTPRGGTQPTTPLDRTTATEHLASPSQGVRPEEVPDGAATAEPTGGGPGPADTSAGGGPDGDEDSGSGPMFEEPA